jgi:hypothetical protein
VIVRRNVRQTEKDTWMDWEMARKSYAEKNRRISGHIDSLTDRGMDRKSERQMVGQLDDSSDGLERSDAKTEG